MIDAENDPEMPGSSRQERLRIVSEQAAYWYLRYWDEPAMSLKDRNQFITWMRASPENVAEFLRATDTDDVLIRGDLSEFLNIGSDSNIIELTASQIDLPIDHQMTKPLPDRDQHKMNDSPISAWHIAAMAAAVALSVLLTLGIKATVFDHTVNTGAGQRQHVTLDDGSVIHAGAQTKIKVEFSGEKRLVRLGKGEAVFEVAQDAKRPFTVSTELIEVTAVGTRFSVSVDPGATVTVSEGIVKVSAHGDMSSARSVMVKAGEEVRVFESALLAPVFSKVNGERKLQWANGWLEFDGETIGEIVAEFNRRNVVQIKIEHPAIAEHRLEGFYRFRVDSPEQFVTTVAPLLGIVVTKDQSGQELRFHLAKRE